MRYYGTEYLNELTKSITAAHDSVGSQDYSSRIRGVKVGSSRIGLKNSGIGAGQRARSHINSVKDKFNVLQTALNTFYGEVDETSSNIVALTDKLDELMSEANSSLVKICNMLNGVGEYKGVCINADIVRSAGVDKQKITEISKEFWVVIIDTEVEGDNLNDDAVEAYVDYLQDSLANRKKLSEDEIARLNAIYKYYIEHRYGRTGDLRGVPMQTVNNCVDVYELLDPKAKKTMDVFFADPIAQNDEIMNRNMARIRYMTYTADPNYRDTILYYMPSLKIGSYDYEERVHYRGRFYLRDWGASSNSLYINIAKDYEEKYYTYGQYTESKPVGAFFHEFGHGIDDVTDLFGYSSDKMYDLLVGDLKSHINEALDNTDRVSISASDRTLIASLSDEERQEVIDYILSYHNSNVVPPAGEDADYFLPWKIGDENYGRMTAAYDYLRNYYGYAELEYVGTADKVYESNSHPPLSDDIKNSREYELVSDIIGGLTNNSLCGDYWSHSAPQDMEDNPEAYHNARDLYNALNDYDYWYSRDNSHPRTPSSHAQHEFFAECFDHNVEGFDLEPSKAIFGNSCASYDEIINKVFSVVKRTSN